MKRTLLLASFLGLGLALYAQNTGAANKGTPGSRGPNAQVTVTPGPQGLPTVNSSASAWPLGPALGENLDYWLNGIPQTGESETRGAPPPAPPPRTSNQTKPSFEPPPMGGLPSFGAPRPGGQPSAAMGPDLAAPNPRLRRDPQNSPVGEETPAPEQSPNPAQSPPGPQRNGSQEQPVSQGSRQNDQPNGSPARIVEGPRQEEGPPPGGRPPAARQNPAPASGNTSPQAAESSGKKVIVVPSPVHYDRAGRRVVDPSWQETMYQMIQAEKQGASPAAEQGGEPAGTGQAAEQNGNPGARDEPAVRETVIVVPGPAVWRIRGTLTVAKGMLALEDTEGVLWYLPGLDRYIGFIDGLEAGEEAALEGYAPPRGSSQERYFQPIRLFIDEMAYDLSIPPYGIAIPAQGSGGQTTIIRETERRNPHQNPGGRGNRGGTAQGKRPGWDYDDDWDEDRYQNPSDRGNDPAQGGRDRRERSPRSNPPAPPGRPAWEHKHTSPWAPPPSVLEFEMDYGSFWQNDPAKQERRERDSREIWY